MTEKWIVVLLSANTLCYFNSSSSSFLTCMSILLYTYSLINYRLCHNCNLNVRNPNKETIYYYFINVSTSILSLRLCENTVKILKLICLGILILKVAKYLRKCVSFYSSVLQNPTKQTCKYQKVKKKLKKTRV